LRWELLTVRIIPWLFLLDLVSPERPSPRPKEFSGD
jgi:hypothetical protein